jgi:DNA invertase Pin-like site-specific DNA recombinase
VYKPYKSSPMTKRGRVPDELKLVPYLRTSTDEQLLRIKAQRDIVKTIGDSRRARLLRPFEEHESGGDRSRPELRKALAYAKGQRATLCVAKVDRLARDSEFLQKLLRGGVPIIFGDLPSVDGSAASVFVIQGLANVAEFERKRIGERTREALAQLKKQGRKLGTPKNLTAAGRAKGSKRGAQAQKKLALEAMEPAAMVASEKRKEGRSLRDIAAYLNGDDLPEGERPREPTRNGGVWSAVQVKRVLNRTGIR